MGVDLDDHPGCVVSFALLACVAFLLALVSIINRLDLPGALAEIEQVRSDLQKVDATKAEDVAGQAVELNRKIVSNQRYNKLWWSGWAIPDEWDKVRIIEINNTVKGEK